MKIGTEAFVEFRFFAMMYRHIEKVIFKRVLRQHSRYADIGVFRDILLDSVDVIVELFKLQAGIVEKNYINGHTAFE